MWTGNWVTFIDSLFQTALIPKRGQTLRLPTNIRYMRIDPAKQAAAIESLEDGTRITRSYRDNTCAGDTFSNNGLSAGGVEMADVNSQTVQRRVTQSNKVDSIDCLID